MGERIVAKQAIGAYPGGTQKTGYNLPLNRKINFPVGFSSTPVVIVTALQDPSVSSTYPDTFSVTVTHVTTTGFNVNITREDYSRPEYSGAGWGQNLHISYVAEIPTY
ncbi:H-type lectin domain-containing protein [Burkholderia stagnalis]|uniref:H-type lectin domain-containing protein n=1 Tax=Burkholderia stagnalis TaxID=1503054 RepID=UPI002AB4A5CC|nr:H-type lectin domain-containing protein [Burkholderia stagnalis]MDY7804731.1 H-type lectin domain-containing protein [Burkholderia stagnalis]